MIVLLEDAGDETREETPIKIKMEKGNLGIGIHVDGFGVYEGNEYAPIFFEIYNGVPRLVIWEDINSSEPKIISLEKARISERIPENG